MIQLFTPFPGACPDGERFPFGELATEEDQLFSNQIKADLKKIDLQPSSQVIRQVLDYSVKRSR